MKQTILILLIVLLFVLAGCNGAEEKKSDPKILLNEKENQLPSSILAKADKEIENNLLKRLPTLRKFNELNSKIYKKDFNSYFAITGVKWTNNKTTINAQIGGGYIRYEKHYKCYEGVPPFCRRSSFVDHRLKIRNILFMKYLVIQENI
ncbi:hypothetical protein GMMP15_830041 [Candidatus Magnetomoraceae bacterium gMMP-15]